MNPTLRVRIARKLIEPGPVCVLDLVPLDGQTLPVFSAGAHIDLHLPGGLVRQYSLCNDPAERHRYQLGVLDDPASRGGSRAVHDLLAVDDEVLISAPRNLFPLAPSAPLHLLMAGGIGLTPLLSMAESLHAAGARFELHHATRSRARTPFMERLQAAPWTTQVHWHHDDDAATTLDIASTLRAAPAGSHVYTCGPRGFMDAVLNTARSLAWREDRLHAESFSAEPATRAGDQTFEVELARSGKVIVVDPDRSVAQALDAAGVLLPTSCEQGVCGTCLTRVIAGTPDHRDQYLTPEEQAANDQFLPCCSRSLSPRLVLDL